MGNEPIISQDTMAALLGRPLEVVEVENYALYLQIAVARLEDLLCLKFEELGELPVDLQLLLARCFGVITREQGDTKNFGVSSKKVEDFSINYDTGAANMSAMEVFVRQNASIIDKYGQCQAKLRSGRTDDCFRCI